MNTEDVTIDSKGSIQIPKAVRDKVGLQVGGKARLKIEKEKIVIMPPISAEEFIEELGCIKEGNPRYGSFEDEENVETYRKIKVS
jgi:AbrB family looped-hinge helix DNA binding protein